MGLLGLHFPSYTSLDWLHQTPYTCTALIAHTLHFIYTHIKAISTHHFSAKYRPALAFMSCVYRCVCLFDYWPRTVYPDLWSFSACPDLCLWPYLALCSLCWSCLLLIYPACWPFPIKLQLDSSVPSLHIVRINYSVTCRAIPNVCILYQITNVNQNINCACVCCYPCDIPDEQSSYCAMCFYHNRCSGAGHHWREPSSAFSDLGHPT